MANHRADGRATVRKHRAVGGTHRDHALPAGAVKAGVLGVLATATIAAPLAAAAAGTDEAAPAEPIAQAPAAAPQAAAAIAPVTLPGATATTEAAVEERDAEGDAASRSEERTAPAGAEDAAEDEVESTGIEVSVPEPEPVVTEAAAGAEGAEGTDSADGEAVVGSDSGYIRPSSGAITSGYGGRVHPVLGYYKGHDGVDFGAACGAPVKAAKSGTVVAVEYHHASGNRVKIDHGNGVVTGYYHLQGFNTSVGATVAQGDTIGYVGSTGRSTGCHLHFAKMDEAGNYSDPMSLLR
ncbi:M23 family metallopeptidase [Brachybacterium sp. GU-2]|uniref:M23 family metallopeptidase n=1 Tax=Brachybacterium sp. GU-2 TaxID=3069708 RepID=UPI00280B193B|nr:M23 family metallopeptidase [Brachybacterium sp. GU-2]WME24688.1 M23 family metallopeptidase [Brachybacterium sp. GU-2]